MGRVANGGVEAPKGSYAAALVRLQAQLDSQRLALRQQQRSLLVSEEREAILVELVLHQELMLSLLAEQRAVLAAMQAGVPSALLGAAAGAAATVGGGSARRAAEQLQPHSYVARLLCSTTPEHLARASRMGVQEWRAELTRLFPRLVVLLELMNRSGDASCWQEQYDCDGDADVLQQQKHPERGSPGAMSSGSSGACGGTPASLLDLPACPGLSPQQDSEQLHDLVDDVMRLVLLAYLHDPNPLLQAAMAGYGPGMAHLTAVPAGHWQRVADRLQLSPPQQLHFAVAHQEYTRVSQQMCAEGNSLVSKSAAQALLLVAAALSSPSSSGSSSLDSGVSIVQDAHSPPALAAPAAAHQYGSIAAATHRLRRGQAAPRAGAAPRRRSGTPLRCVAASLAAAAAGAVVSGSSPHSSGAPAAAPACSDVGGSSGPRDEEELVGDEGAQLDRQLRRYVGRRQLYLIGIVMFLFNTLTRHQIAVMVVAAWPFFPGLTAVAGVFAQREQQRWLQGGGEEPEQGGGGEAAAAAGPAAGPPGGAGGRAKPGRRRAASACAAAAAAGGSAAPGLAAQAGCDDYLQATVRQHAEAHMQQRQQALSEQHARWLASIAQPVG